MVDNMVDCTMMFAIDYTTICFLWVKITLLQKYQRIRQRGEAEMEATERTIYDTCVAAIRYLSTLIFLIASPHSSTAL